MSPAKRRNVDQASASAHQFIDACRRFVTNVSPTYIYDTDGGCSMIVPMIADQSAWVRHVSRRHNRCGMAVNSTIFGGVYAVLVKPLPIRETARLVVGWKTNPSRTLNDVSATWVFHDER